MERKALAGVVLAALAIVAGAVAAGAPAKRPGYIVGRATFANGRPIPQFVVKAYGFDGKVNVNPAGLPFLGQTIGTNGTYALQTKDSIRQRTPVDALVRGVSATTTLVYHGHTYTLPLWPADGKADGTGAGDFSGRSGGGIVRNFVLHLSGLRPGFAAYKAYETSAQDDGAGAFYGGNLILALNLGDSTGPLTLTLKPDGPLLDGSRGAAVTRQITLGAGQGSAYFYLHSIPTGFYTASASLNGTPLRLGLLGGSEAATAPVDFLPTDELPDGGASITLDVDAAQ